MQSNLTPNLIFLIAQNPEQLHCYCDKMSVIQQSENSLCNTYLQNNIKSQVLQYFAAFVVILVNLMLEVPFPLQ